MKIFKMLLPSTAIFMMVNSVFAQTWTQTSAPSTNWFGIVSSADGSKLVAVANNANFGAGPIYTSTNSGTTWTLSSAPFAEWSSVASSADGSKLAAIMLIDLADGGRIYTSTNSGISWIQQTGAPNQDWWSVASSA